MAPYDIAARGAAFGYSTVLCAAENLYFDLAASDEFSELGLSWAGLVDLQKVESPFYFAAKESRARETRRPSQEDQKNCPLGFAFSIRSSWLVCLDSVFIGSLFERPEKTESILKSEKTSLCTSLHLSIVPLSLYIGLFILSFWIQSLDRNREAKCRWHSR